MATTPYTAARSTFSASAATRSTATCCRSTTTTSRGFKETLDIEPIYEAYEDLTRLETAQRLESAPPELWRFACEGFLGNLTRSHQAKAAEVEATIEAKVDGETFPYRMLRVAMSNEPDRGKRQRLDEERIRLLDEHLNPLYLDAHRIDRDAVRDLNAPNYYELYKRFGFRLDELAAECRAVLDDTEKLWEREGDALFRTRLGFGLGEAKPWDVGRLFRAPELDAQYPADKMLPALEATLTELGIDIRSQTNVHLDLEARPSKSPRAFCAPIEVPGKVMLVIQPIGGKDDWEALFHEAGHTEHYALHQRQPLDGGQRLGDNAVTEGWAMLMQHLVTEPAWLSRRLDAPNVDATRQGRRRLAPLLRAPLLREAPLRDRALPGRRPDDGAEPLRRAPVGRAEDPDPLRELPRRRRRQLLRDRLPPLVGVRGAAPRFPARRVRE